ncbi:phosphoenolpyruvate carboxylase gene [Tanacetum coccineum]
MGCNYTFKMLQQLISLPKLIHGMDRGILYLHEHSSLQIIHKDLKAVHGRLSIKSRVFSFGVTVLEMVSGMKKNSLMKTIEITFLDMHGDYTKENKSIELLSESLQNNADAGTKEVINFLKTKPVSYVIDWIKTTNFDEGAIMFDIYEENKDEDGFLYMTYNGTFGGIGTASLLASLLTSVLPTTLEDLIALGICSASGKSSTASGSKGCRRGTQTEAKRKKELEREVAREALQKSELDAKASHVYSYTKCFNAFAAKLIHPEARELSGMDGMESVILNQNRILHTTRSWDFIGLPQTTSRKKFESDIIVGIPPQSDSFNEDGFGPPPAKWKGSCAKYFKLDGNPDPNDSLSPVDTDGHGTHKSSTAAGISVASFHAMNKGILTVASAGNDASKRDKLYNTRERARHMLAHDVSEILEELVYTNIEQFLKPLELCYRSLCACSDRIISYGGLLDFIRQVSTFGLSLVRLDICQETDRHTDVLDMITQHLQIGTYREWSEEK